MSSKKTPPDADNPFLAIDKSLFTKEKRQGRDNSYSRNRNLTKTGKGQQASGNESGNDDSDCFSDLMNLGGVEKLKGQSKAAPSQTIAPARSAEEEESAPWPLEWTEETASFARQEEEAPKPSQKQNAPANRPLPSEAFGSMAGLMAGIKAKDASEPEPANIGHDRKQEDKMLEEYLASANSHPEKTGSAPNAPPQQPENPGRAVLEEEEDFTLAMQQVAPLSGKGREVVLKPPTAAVPPAPDNPLQDFVDGKIEFSLAFTEEYMEGHVLGVDPAIIGKLRAGAYSYEAHLDLHGLNSAQAFDSLVAFIKQSYMTGKRTVLIITGRGKNSPDGSGILRSKLEEWLPQEPFKRVVLAFCTALPKHGGPGAVYVMLRKLKKSRGKIHWDRTPNDPDLFT